MKKSRGITLTILASVAMTACKPKEAQRCVDQSNIVVEDRRCEDDEEQRRGNPAYVPSYHWYYGGRGFNIGSPATDGSLNPHSGASTVRPNISTSRGGLGSTGAAHSGGSSGSAGDSAGS